MNNYIICFTSISVTVVDVVKTHKTFILYINKKKILYVTQRQNQIQNTIKCSFSQCINIQTVCFFKTLPLSLYCSDDPVELLVYQEMTFRQLYLRVH